MMYYSQDKQTPVYSPFILSRRRSQRRFAKSDFLYIILYTLVIAGVTLRVEHAFVKNVVPSASAAGIKVIKAITPTLRPLLPGAVTPTPKIIYVKSPAVEDLRSIRLRKYLESYGSPLAPYSALIIEQSDEHAIDWTLMVSIAGKESTLGKNTKQECHNPFGLGGTTPMCFSTWEEAISYEAKLLGQSYRSAMISGIQPIYCPSFECDQHWSKDVVWFAKDILAKGK